MADRSLKGTGLGAKSFEDEAGVERVRTTSRSATARGSTNSTLVFAAEAEIPSYGNAHAAVPSLCVLTVSVRP